MTIPKRFFVTSGKGVSEVSPMNAFDRALVDAGISEATLVPVSSVLPDDIEEIEGAPIKRGSIVFCILSRADGIGGETIFAGLAYLRRTDGSGGYVAEAQCKNSSTELEKELEMRARQMAASRDATISEIKYRYEELRIPDMRFGCCVIALIFLP